MALSESAVFLTLLLFAQVNLADFGQKWRAPLTTGLRRPKLITSCTRRPLQLDLDPWLPATSLKQLRVLPSPW